MMKVFLILATALALCAAQGAPATAETPMLVPGRAQEAWQSMWAGMGTQERSSINEAVRGMVELSKASKQNPAMSLEELSAGFAEAVRTSIPGTDISPDSMEAMATANAIKAGSSMSGHFDELRSFVADSDLEGVVSGVEAHIDRMRADNELLFAPYIEQDPENAMKLKELAMPARAGIEEDLSRLQSRIVQATSKDEMNSSIEEAASDIIAKGTLFNRQLLSNLAAPSEFMRALAGSE